MALHRENHRRLFFALWPDEAERAALAEWQPALQELCGGKAMRSDTLHCTLVFLGEVAARQLPALLQLAQGLPCFRFDLCLSEARYWAHNRIVYAAPAGVPAELAALVAALEGALHRHRFHFDQRAFQPHITLLRHARWTAAPLPPLPPVCWQMDDFALVESVRDEQGARYEVLSRILLPPVE